MFYLPGGNIYCSIEFDFWDLQCFLRGLFNSTFTAAVSILFYNSMHRKEDKGRRAF